MANKRISAIYQNNDYQVPSLEGCPKGLPRIAFEQGAGWVHITMSEQHASGNPPVGSPSSITNSPLTITKSMPTGL